MRTEKEIREEFARVTKLAKMFPEIQGVQDEYETQKSVFVFVLGDSEN